MPLVRAQICNQSKKTTVFVHADDILATKDFNIETSSIPYTNGENEYKEDAAAERTVVKEEYYGYFRKDCVNWVTCHKLAVFTARRYAHLAALP